MNITKEFTLRIFVLSSASRSSNIEITVYIQGILSFYTRFILQLTAVEGG